MNLVRALFVAAVSACAAVSAGAQTITLGELACLPSGENGVVTVRVEPPPPAEVEVRLYFRRMNLLVEDFYFTVMAPSGAGTYWGIFPQPEPSDFTPQELRAAKNHEHLWAQWWRAKEASEHRDPNTELDREVIEERASLGKREKRDWMSARDDRELEEFLRRQRHEPAEYFVGLYDPANVQLARSAQHVVAVRDDCTAALTPQQAGMAMNLTVGETSKWQVGNPVFHWECTGIVTRVDAQRVLRGDEACRACVVGWWPLAGASVLGALAVHEDDPTRPVEISPSRP